MIESSEGTEVNVLALVEPAPPNEPRRQKKKFSVDQNQSLLGAEPRKLICTVPPRPGQCQVNRPTGLLRLERFSPLPCESPIIRYLRGR